LRSFDPFCRCSDDKVWRSVWTRQKAVAIPASAHLDTTTIVEGPPAPSPCKARAGRGLGRGAPSIELAWLIGIPSPLPSPHSSVVGRGNRPAAWGGVKIRPSRVLRLGSSFPRPLCQEER